MACRIQSKIATFLLHLFILLAGCHPNIRPNEPPYLLTEAEKALLKSGDIILRKGEGMLSQFICERLNDTIQISHCGILIKENNDLKVIHSLSKEVSDKDGVQCCTFDRFTTESVKGSIIIVRCKSDTTGIMASRALHYLRIQKPFDRLFNLQDSTAFFCSELPLHVLKQALGQDITHHNSVPKFSLFLNQHYFDIIYSSDYPNHTSQESKR